MHVGCHAGLVGPSFHSRRRILAHVVGLVNPSEKVNGLWLVVAAACIYVLAYRFYGVLDCLTVVELNDQRVTPAVRLNDGVNPFIPQTGSCFSDTTSLRLPGPVRFLGRFLRRNSVFFPGFLWLVIGAVLAGAVQDFIILSPRCVATGVPAAPRSPTTNWGRLPAPRRQWRCSLSWWWHWPGPGFAVVNARPARQRLGNLHDCDDDPDRFDDGLLPSEVS
ncbi:MAG: carbon starvation CstA family protein [Nitrospiraceae bacterium]